MRNSPIAQVGVMGMVLACVPQAEEEIAAAPCPCPNGYRCCDDRCTPDSDPCKSQTSNENNEPNTEETRASSEKESDTASQDRESDSSPSVEESDTTSTGGETDSSLSDGETDTPTSDGESHTPSAAGESDTPSTSGESDMPSTLGESDTQSSSGESDTAVDGGLSSSNIHCERDRTCLDDEVCISWELPDGGVRGMKRCRRACHGPACPESQICELVLHDAQPIGEVHVALACIDDTVLPEGCSEVGCRECAQAPVGSTYSGGTTCSSDLTAVTGCFIALDPACGLLCRTHTLEVCAEDSICEPHATGAQCSEPVWTRRDWCGSYPCDMCTPASSSGDTDCVCWSMPLPQDACKSPPCSCEEICPDVFVLNEDTEKAEVINPEGGPEDLIEEAMEACPVECIHWED